jgi:hypothetical protein
MSSVETAYLPTVDPEGIEIAPAMPGKLEKAAPPTITLGELRDFAIPRYRDQLSSIRDAQGEVHGDQSRHPSSCAGSDVRVAVPGALPD